MKADKHKRFIERKTSFPRFLTKEESAMIDPTEEVIVPMKRLDNGTPFKPYNIALNVTGAIRIGEIRDLVENGGTFDLGRELGHFKDRAQGLGISWTNNAAANKKAILEKAKEVIQDGDIRYTNIEDYLRDRTANPMITIQMWKNEEAFDAVFMYDKANSKLSLSSIYKVNIWAYLPELKETFPEVNAGRIPGLLYGSFEVRTQ